jgi:ubiquinone/menaquinone biosynthesis C-methylase UbiE
MPSTSADYKEAAIECWTADPCLQVEGEPGTNAYLQRLLEARQAYAPWMAEFLGYETTRGLDVLDVGCGQGIDLVRYGMAGARPTGIDLTPRHVELARLHLAAADLPGRVVQGDAERLPFEDDSFDRVSSNGVLHHTPNIEQALHEILRVLRPGGEARIIVYNRRSFHYWLTQVFYEGLLRRRLFRERSMAGVLSSGVERSSIGGRPLVRVYTAREVKTMLDAAGFASSNTSVRHFHASDTPFTYVLEKRVRALRDPEVLDRIGKIGGWYVVGRGMKHPDS